MACIADHDDKKIIYCEGTYDFTGEYQIVDDKGVLLTSRTINVIPNDGEKWDNVNLLNEKFLFDNPSIGAGLELPSIVFSEVGEKSTLIFETTDLFVEPSHRVLYILKGETQIAINFEVDKVNAEIKEDGGIIIPKGNNLIKVSLNKISYIFREKGVTLMGYGFGLKALYIE